jgi:DNA-binding protein HU-beta
MTKKELVRTIAEATGYEQVTISNILESALDCIKDSLCKDETIYLRGFGAFSARAYKARIAQDIKGKKSIVVPAHRLPYFKPYNEFKDLLNADQPNK